jgi:hypothetical protein
MNEKYVQALRTLSGKIMGIHSLNDLLSEMLTFVAHYSGADRTYFIMERKGRLFIVASIGKRGENLRVRGRAVESSDEINFALATEIAVTKRRQLYQNTLAEDHQKDYRVHQDQQQVAVVAEPLLDKEKLLGFFYMEFFERNYSQKVIEFFDLTGPGLTCALHNAIRTIEAKREHEMLRLKLEKVAKEKNTQKDSDAEMTFEEAYERAKAASYVLHKLGNVLNAALMLGEEMEEIAEELPPLDKLNSVQELLVNHEGQLADFLANDERGKKVPDFLIAAAQKLGAERSEFFGQLKNMNSLLSEMRELMLYHQDKVNKME